MDQAFRPWLGGAAKELRLAADLKPRVVAVCADVDQSTIYRFEDPDETSWPRNVDTIICGYAEAVGGALLDLRTALSG